MHVCVGHESKRGYENRGRAIKMGGKSQGKGVSVTWKQQGNYGGEEVEQQQKARRKAVGEGDKLVQRTMP